MLRAGHLAWDSYEPQDGVYAFEWFDEFLGLAHEHEIGVILDVPVRPAPLWLHRKHPSIDIVNVHGKRQHANTRYMEDVGDPHYLRHALRFADLISRRYAAHPAVLAFGIDNEPGSGPYSYSDTVRVRFVEWLQHKYTTTAALNDAWAGQRWSRRISDFEDVDLPRSGFYDGTTQRMMDFRAFVSDEIVAAHTAVIDTVSANAPDKLITGNQWYYREGEDGRFFDYAPIAYSGSVTRGGAGLYPRNSQLQTAGLHHALAVIARIQFESPTPHWAVEATTETAAPGAVRKAAFASLLYGNQMMCGWTWQTHHAAEEQYMQGMVDWDGETNRKYAEYAQIAREFRLVEKFGFPYRANAHVALAFSFASQLASAPFPELHDQQLETAFGSLLNLNLDTRVVDINRSPLDYRILVLPGLAVIDEPTAARVRQFVESGGTLIMTSYSAVADQHGQALRTTRPGLLHDVFGIRVGSYQEPSVLNEVSERKLPGDRVSVVFESGEAVEVEAPRFDEVHLRGASVLASIDGLDQPYAAVTAHTYGAGRAIYISLPVRGDLLLPVLDSESTRLGIHPSVDAPRGVIGRALDPNHALFVNLTPETQTIRYDGPTRDLLSGREYEGPVSLAPFDVEFIEKHERG